MGQVVGTQGGEAVVTALAAILIASALAIAPAGSAGLGERFDAEVSPQAGSGSAGRNRMLAAGAAGAAVWLFAGAGFLAAVLGVFTAGIALRVFNRLSDNQPVDAAALRRQAADAAELMAACLASGASLPRTTSEVALALDDPIAGLLRECSSLMAMGASGEQAWRALAHHEATAPISRAVIRSEVSGAPTAEALAQCAVDLRDQRKSAASTMVRSVTVATVGPLGLCFLPAFVLLGVVPIVAGLIGGSVAGS